MPHTVQNTKYQERTHATKCDVHQKCLQMGIFNKILIMVNDVIGCELDFRNRNF
jgi:hypothetical protein